MKFAARTAWDLAEADLSKVANRARERHPDLLDLTESNPTRVSLMQADALPTRIEWARGTRYDPDPRGVLSAREAVAAYYRERGLVCDPSRTFLSASTSEAYAWLFKLLCDPGDTVLVPTPSYPLFSYLAGLEHARVETYPLLREEGFRVDLAELERKVSAPSVRAIVVVAPNNPTGTLLVEADAAAIERLAFERGVPIIVDEVFSDYVWKDAPASLRRSFVGETTCLSFVLSGLSKVCCAPGLKLGWSIVQGPEDLVNDASARLEVIADTFLSVGTPVQAALPSILAARRDIQGELIARLEQNRADLERAVRSAASGSMRVVPSHGGWTALLEVPRVQSEDAWVTALALEDGVLVQPGYFFDLHDRGTLALSLIVSPERMRRGVAALVDRVESSV